MTCTVAGCDEPHLAQGLCNKHYLRLRAHGDASHPVQEREAHGMTGTPIYEIWSSMVQRSTPGSYAQRRHPTYVGVGRDPRWDSFTAFYEDMGASYFPGAALARHGDTGDYRASNVRWLTPSENTREMSRTPRIKHRTVDGRPAIDVAREHDIDPSTLRRRIASGWSVDVAATVPVVRGGAR